jgi:hypothetical protein
MPAFVALPRLHPPAQGSVFRAGMPLLQPSLMMPPCHALLTCVRGHLPVRLNVVHRVSRQRCCSSVPTRPRPSRPDASFCPTTPLFSEACANVRFCQVRFEVFLRLPAFHGTWVRSSCALVVRPPAHDRGDCPPLTQSYNELTHSMSCRIPTRLERWQVVQDTVRPVNGLTQALKRLRALTRPHQ